MRLLIAITSFLLCSASLWARIGVVRTINGQVFEGHIRITPEQIVIVNLERDAVFRVDGSNVVRISFPTNVALTPSSERVDEPLPSMWREIDVGGGFVSGSTRYERGTFTVRGSGSGIDGTADSFHFVCKAVRGDSEVVARLASIQYTHPIAKAGLMMRENLGESARHIMIALTAMRGGAWQYRANERSDTEGIRLGGLFAPQWLKLKRHSNEFSAFVSANGRRWLPVGKISLEMNQNFYVGLAVASARDGLLNWTTFREVREAPKLINENFVPEVELVSGSTVTGRPARVEDDEIIFQGAPKMVRVPTDRIARIAFQPLSSELAWKTRVSRSGVWVSNGDFFDGEFRGLERSRLTISSVLYGLREFDVDDEVIAVVLRSRRPQRPSYEVETMDGSRLLASEMTLGDGEIKLREPALGEVRVPSFEIVEFRRR